MALSTKHAQPNAGYRRIVVASCVMLGLIVACTRAPEPEPIRLTSYVDPFIGTDGPGNTFPGATLPFGMVQLGPDTRLVASEAPSGYRYTDDVIYGFSHTHLSGTARADFCDILVMPTAGDIRLSSVGDTTRARYASRFRKETESVHPGFYAVHLDDPDVDVALTCTERAGFHRYVFPTNQPPSVIVDLEHRDAVIGSRLAVVGPNEIEGHRISSSWAKEQSVYFVARFSKPIASYGLSESNDWAAGPDQGDRAGDFETAELEGKRLKGLLLFEPGDTLLVKVGLSAVDVDGARRNLDEEIPGWNFEAVRDSADAIWEQALAKIVVDEEPRRGRRSRRSQPGDAGDAKRTIFYTALYHTMIAPNLFSDVDGRYRGTDLEIHKSPIGPIYTVFPLWDTFRAAHPLYTIIERARTGAFLNTFLLQYRDGGKLPLCEIAGNYTGTGIGYPAIPVIADAWTKGIRDIDVRTALSAMVTTAEAGQPGLEAYIGDGYIDSGRVSGSVSRTLAYAYADWCIARALSGDPALHRARRRFMRRAQSYKNLFDPTTGFIRPRDRGMWYSPFDPSAMDSNYTDANAWQYTFFVPQDTRGLAEMLGGEDLLDTKIDELFEAPPVPGSTGMIGQYAHGNAVDHHVAYLYDTVGKPWKTQRRVRQIMDEMYTAGPNGLVGNDNCGQLSAWYVLSAMGFYPVTPGVASYAIGSPAFPRVAIALEDGKEFVIRAENVSKENMYIQSATLNGEPYLSSVLDQETILAGGELDFVMGREANPQWGDLDHPQTEIDDEILVPVPYFVAESRTFSDSLHVEIGVACRDCRITIRVNREGYTQTSEMYNGPLTLTSTTQILAVAVGHGATLTGVIADFIKVPAPDRSP